LDTVQILFTHKQINIPHRPRGDIAIESLGECKTTQGQAGDPLIAERTEKLAELSGKRQVPGGDTQTFLAYPFL
jgi:hypothetical protein